MVFLIDCSSSARIVEGQASTPQLKNSHARRSKDMDGIGWKGVRHCRRRRRISEDILQRNEEARKGVSAAADGSPIFFSIGR